MSNEKKTPEWLALILIAVSAALVGYVAYLVDRVFSISGVGP